MDEVEHFLLDLFLPQLLDIVVRVLQDELQAPLPSVDSVGLDAAQMLLYRLRSCSRPSA